MNIRPADSSDHEALVGLQRRSSLAAYAHVFPPDEYPFPIDATRQHWRRVLTSDTERVLVAEDEEGGVIGAVAVRGPEVHSLFVSPNRWRSGVGSALLAAAVLLIRERGETSAQLWVMRDNQHARRFYEFHGWELDGRRDVSSFPPHPKLLGYRLDLARTPTDLPLHRDVKKPT
jgi:ribosomal protein S18 acetylase RimI-like enzyme